MPSKGNIRKLTTSSESKFKNMQHQLERSSNANRTSCISMCGSQPNCGGGSQNSAGCACNCCQQYDTSEWAGQWGYQNFYCNCWPCYDEWWACMTSCLLQDGHGGLMPWPVSGGYGGGKGGQARSGKQHARVCEDKRACNYRDTKECNYDCYGCTDPNADNFDEWATFPCNGTYGRHCGDTLGANCCCEYSRNNNNQAGGPGGPGRPTPRTNGLNPERLHAGAPLSMGWPPLDYTVVPMMMDNCGGEGEVSCCEKLCETVNDAAYNTCLTNCESGGSMYGAHINWHPLSGDGNYMYSWRGSSNPTGPWGSWSCDKWAEADAQATCWRNNMAWVFPSLNTCDHDEFNWLDDDWGDCISPVETTFMMMQNAKPTTLVYFYESEIGSGMGTPGRPESSGTGTYSSSPAHILHSEFTATNQFPASHTINNTAPNVPAQSTDLLPVESIPISPANVDYTFLFQNGDWEENPLDPCTSSGDPGCGQYCKQPPFTQPTGQQIPGTFWTGDGCWRGSFFRTLTMDETPYRELDIELTIIDDSNHSDWAPGEATEGNCLIARETGEPLTSGQGFYAAWGANVGKTCQIPSCQMNAENASHYLSTAGVQAVLDLDHPFNQPCSNTNQVMGSTALGNGQDLFNAWWCNVDLAGLGAADNTDEVPINVTLDSSQWKLMIHYNAYDGLRRYFGVYPDFTNKRVGWAWTDDDGDGVADEPAFDDNGDRLPDLFGRHLHEIDFMWQEYAYGNEGGKGVCLEYMTDPTNDWSEVYDYGNQVPHSYRYDEGDAARCACPGRGDTAATDDECYGDGWENPCSGMKDYSGNCCCAHNDAPAGIPSPLFAAMATGNAPEGYGAWLSDLQGTTIEPADPWLNNLAGSAIWIKGDDELPVQDDASGFSDIITQYESDLGNNLETFITLRPENVTTNEHKWAHYSNPDIINDYTVRPGDACVCPGTSNSGTTISQIPNREGVGVWEWEDISGNDDGTCVFDCSGQCVEARYVMDRRFGIGDGYCDDNIERIQSGGFTEFNYLNPDCGSWTGVCLNCPEFFNDGGDCSEVSTPTHPHGSGFYVDGGNQAKKDYKGHQPGPCLCGHETTDENSQYHLINTMPYGWCAWPCPPEGCSGCEIGYAYAWMSMDACICDVMDGELVQGYADWPCNDEWANETFYCDDWGCGGGCTESCPGWTYWGTCTQANIKDFDSTCGDPYGGTGTGAVRCQYNHPPGWHDLCCEYEANDGLGGENCLDCAKAHYPDMVSDWFSFEDDPFWGWWMDQYMINDASDPMMRAEDCRGCHIYSGLMLKDCSYYDSNPGSNDVPKGVNAETLDMHHHCYDGGTFSDCMYDGIEPSLQADGVYHCTNWNCAEYPAQQSDCGRYQRNDELPPVPGHGTGRTAKGGSRPSKRKQITRVARGLNGVRGKSVPVRRRDDDQEWYVFKVIGVTNLGPAGFSDSSALTLEPYIRGNFGTADDGNMNWTTDAVGGLTLLSNRNHPGLIQDSAPWNPDGNYQGTICSECAPTSNASLDCVLACGNWYTRTQYCGDGSDGSGDDWMCGAQSWHYYLSNNNVDEGYANGNWMDDNRPCAMGCNALQDLEVQIGSLGSLQIISPEGIAYELPALEDVPDVDWYGDYSVIPGSGTTWFSPIIWNVQSNPNCYHTDLQTGVADDGSQYLSGGQEVILEITDNGQICNSMDSPFPPPVGFWAVGLDIGGQENPEYYRTYEWGQSTKQLSNGEFFSWGHWACFYPPHWEVPRIAELAVAGDTDDNQFGIDVAEWARAWCDGNDCSSNPALICPNTSGTDHNAPAANLDDDDCLTGSCWSKWCADAGPTVMPPFAETGTAQRMGDRVGGKKLLNSYAVIEKWLGFNGEDNDQVIYDNYESWVMSGTGDNPDNYEGYGNPCPGNSCWFDYNGSGHMTYFGSDYPYGRAEYSRFRFRMGVPEGGMNFNSGRSSNSGNRNTVYLDSRDVVGDNWSQGHPTVKSGRHMCDTLGPDYRCYSVSKSGGLDEGESNGLTNRWRGYDGNFEDYDGHLSDGEMCVYGEELADTGGEGFNTTGFRIITCATEQPPEPQTQGPPGGLGTGQTVPYSGDIHWDGQLITPTRPPQEVYQCYGACTYGCDDPWADEEQSPLFMDHDWHEGDIYIQEGHMGGPFGWVFIGGPDLEERPRNTNNHALPVCGHSAEDSGGWLDARWMYEALYGAYGGYQAQGNTYYPESSISIMANPENYDGGGVILGHESGGPCMSYMVMDELQSWIADNGYHASCYTNNPPSMCGDYGDSGSQWSGQDIRRRVCDHLCYNLCGNYNDNQDASHGAYDAKCSCDSDWEYSEVGATDYNAGCPGWQGMSDTLKCKCRPTTDFTMEMNIYYRVFQYHESTDGMPVPSFELIETNFRNESIEDWADSGGDTSWWGQANIDSQWFQPVDENGFQNLYESLTEQFPNNTVLTGTHDPDYIPSRPDNRNRSGLCDCGGNCYPTDEDGIPNDNGQGDWSCNDCQESDLVGCMDDTACNYNPAAVIGDTCEYPGQYCDCDGNIIVEYPAFGEAECAPYWNPCEYCNCFGTVNYGCGCNNIAPAPNGQCPGDGILDCYPGCNTSADCPTGKWCDTENCSGYHNQEGGCTFRMKPLPYR